MTNSRRASIVLAILLSLQVWTPFPVWGANAQAAQSNAETNDRHVSVPIIWKACYELENNAKDILKQGKEIFPRRDRLYYFSSNISYYLSTLRQEMDGAQPSAHWSGVWAEMQQLAREIGTQYNSLVSAIDEVPQGAPVTQKDLATYPSGPWKFRDPAKVIVTNASKIKKLLLVVSMRLGRAPLQVTAGGGTGSATTSAAATSTAGTGTAGAAISDSASAAKTETARTTKSDSADAAGTGAASSPNSDSASAGLNTPPGSAASATSGTDVKEMVATTQSVATPNPDASESARSDNQGLQAEQSNSSASAPPQSKPKSDGKTLTGQAHRLQAKIGAKLVSQTAKKIQASATSLVNELERWNLLWGEPPPQGTSTIRFGGGLTPAQVLTQFYYLPYFSFTMPSYTQFSYRLPPRHKFLVHYTRETGKLINLMNREIEATSFTKEQMAVASGPWSEVQNIFSDVVTHYMELYKLVTEYNDKRLKLNILEDQLKFGKSIVAIHEDMDRLNRVLTDVNAIVKQ